MGERRPAPDVVEAFRFRRERQADLINNGNWMALVNDALEIIDGRTAGYRVVPHVLEDAPHELGNRGLLT